MKILAYAASLRRGSLNRKLIGEAVDIAGRAGADVNLVEFRDFPLPVYDGDLESGEGIPEGARRLGALVAGCDGLMIATPEYNFGVSGAFKNAVDWVSRLRPIPFRGRSCLLMATSPGRTGGARGLLQARVPLESLGAIVYPDMFSLSQGGQAFGEDDRFLDPKDRERLAKMVEGYLEIARRLAT